MHKQDLVCQGFQSDEEDWMNGGEQSPAFATAFSPNDPESIPNGFEECGQFLRTMEVPGDRLALLPGCDVLEEQK